METIRKVYKFIKCALYACLLLSALVGIGVMDEHFRPRTVRQIVEVVKEKIVEVEPPPFTAEEALAMAPEYGVPELWFRGLLVHENSGRWRPDSVKCEFQSDFTTRAARNAAARLVKLKVIDKSDEQGHADAMRCSYGPFQVMGYNIANYLDEPYSVAIKDMRKATVAALKRSQECFDEGRKKGLQSPRQLYWHAYYCYVGKSSDGEAAANKRMGWIYDQLLGADAMPVFHAVEEEEGPRLQRASLDTTIGNR